MKVVNWYLTDKGSTFANTYNMRALHVISSAWKQKEGGGKTHIGTLTR